jgi:hypothetical protein
MTRSSRRVELNQRMDGSFQPRHCRFITLLALLSWRWDSQKFPFRLPNRVSSVLSNQSCIADPPLRLYSVRRNETQVSMVTPIFLSFVCGVLRLQGITGDATRIINTEQLDRIEVFFTLPFNRSISVDDYLQHII